MSKLEFSKISEVESKKFLKYIMDFEYYPNYFPDQLPDVSIIKQENGEYITEEKRIFEPYNLDNSAVVFQDGPYAGHGVRPLLKGAERHAIQIYLQEDSDEIESSKPIANELPEL